MIDILAAPLGLALSLGVIYHCSRSLGARRRDALVWAAIVAVGTIHSMRGHRHD